MHTHPELKLPWGHYYAPCLKFQVGFLGAMRSRFLLLRRYWAFSSKSWGLGLFGVIGRMVPVTYTFPPVTAMFWAFFTTIFLASNISMQWISLGVKQWISFQIWNQNKLSRLTTTKKNHQKPFIYGLYNRLSYFFACSLV